MNAFDAIKWNKKIMIAFYIEEYHEFDDNLQSHTSLHKLQLKHGWYH